MPYLVKLADGTWIRRGKSVKSIDNATIFPHPSAAKAALTSNEGAKLIPFAEEKDAWRAAVAHSPKTWLTCPKGESFKDKKSETGHKCVKRGLISDADGGAPKEVLAQDLLNTHFQPIAGFRAVAVGILPELVIGANTNYYSTTTVLVAYRLDAKN